MLFSDKKEDSDHDHKNEQSVRTPLMKFDLENMDEATILPDPNSKAIAISSKQPSKSSVGSQPTLSETTCNSRKSSKKVAKSI